MPLYIKGRSFLINTFPYVSLGDVGFHEMQYPLLGSNPPPYGHTCPRVWGPHFQLGHGFDAIYNDPTLLV